MLEKDIEEERRKCMSYSLKNKELEGKLQDLEKSKQQEKVNFMNDKSKDDERNAKLDEQFAIVR